MLLDTHHHFDFLDRALREPFLVALADASVDVRLVAQTLTPTSFEELSRETDLLAGAGVPLPLPSLGFHPWWVTDDHADAELEVFSRAVHETRFIGEIGLDLGPRRVEAAPAGLQHRVLRELLQHVRRAADDSNSGEPYVLSIHAVRATTDVLDLLDELDVASHNVVPVFHRFAGTSDELTRLVRLGGHISAHPQLLASKRGRAYVTQVPADRLLLESDLPTEPIPGAMATDAENAAAELVERLSGALSTLSELREQDMTAEIARTQARLYGLG